MILAADDVGDREVDVVDDAGERVERRAVGADQHRIGQRADVDGLLAAHDVRPRDERRLAARDHATASVLVRNSRQWGFSPAEMRWAISSGVSFNAVRS